MIDKEPDSAVVDNTVPVQMLWPIPFLRKHFAQASRINQELVTLFSEHRRLHDKDGAAVYSSDDDLLVRYNNSALNELFAFISSSVFEIASAVNGDIWQQSQSRKMHMNVVGAWFQIQNHHGFHDVHNHGNCSWSGVYYVQADDSEKRENHPSLGAMNGVTRFYAPSLDLLGGAYMDSGNLYLQKCHFDSKPEEGVLCVFPSYLKHMVMPYVGEKDRIIVSFNAQVHGEEGDQAFNHGFF